MTTATASSRSPARGGQTARVALAPVVVRALDVYLDGRATGRIFVARNGASPYSYRPAYDHFGRLCRAADLPAGVTPPHSLRHSYATEFLRLGATPKTPLGHADPRTTRRYDRSRHNLDRSPQLPSRRSLLPH